MHTTTYPDENNISLDQAGYHSQEFIMTANNTANVYSPSCFGRNHSVQQQKGVFSSDDTKKTREWYPPSPQIFSNHFVSYYGNFSSLRVPNACSSEKKLLIRDLIDPCSRYLVTDFTNQILNQMEIIQYERFDRRGRRGKIENGDKGLGCLHCEGRNSNRCGRYFPTSLKSLASTSTQRIMYNHLQACHKLPEEIKQSLHLSYTKHEQESCHRAKLKRGDRTTFFRGVWNILHCESL